MINTPLRQLLLEAEQKVAPTIGDSKKFKALARLGASDVNGLWILIKAAVGTWQDKALFTDAKLNQIQSAGKPSESELIRLRKDLATSYEILEQWTALNQIFMEDMAFVNKLRPGKLCQSPDLTLACGS